MDKKRILFLVIIQFSIISYSQMENYKKLTPEEELVIINKGTEFPNSGIYNNFFKKGVYKCKRCNSSLFLSSAKFKSDCGWPSFDEFISNSVILKPDIDGRRTEIICAKCDAHLGHVFTGEGFTNKNVRHCVNSISLVFMETEKNYQRAILASGCFWGTQYWIAKQKGVKTTNVGYSGGSTDNPTYQMVCTGKTGHAEVVEVVFDPEEISYKELLRLFFNTHDPAQEGGQGPDIGDQYRSEIFYTTLQQKSDAEDIIILLKEKGYDVKTKITPFSKFWIAEDKHQNYYSNTGGSPYCHIFTEKF